MKIFKNMMSAIKDRWAYVLGGYLFGYLVSLMITGIPNIIYLEPIKMLAIIISIIMSTSVYHATESGSYLKALYKSVIPIIAVLGLLVLVAMLYKMLKQNYNIDISPFIGL